MASPERRGTGASARSNPTPSIRRQPARTARTALAAASAVLGAWLFGTGAGTSATAQPVQPPPGPRSVDPGWHAIIGGTVVTEPGTALENATIVIRRGRIVNVGVDVNVPAGARRWDATGHTIYAGLIEPWQPTEAPAPDTDAAGTHWNNSVRAQVTPLDGSAFDADARSALRSRGYAVVHLVPNAGVLRGTSAVISLNEDRPGVPAATVIRDQAMHVAGMRGVGGRGAYPGSRMGVMALLRQSFADAAWRSSAAAAHAADPVTNDRPAPNDAMERLGQDLPIAFEVTDELDALRVAHLAAEFERPATIVGTGTEYRRLDAVVATGRPLIVPLSMAAAPGVASVGEQQRASLRDLMAWEQSPTNLRRLVDAGADVAITSARLRRGEKFQSNLRRAIKHGLTEDAALAAMTVNPARQLGIDGRYGRIAPGLAASLTVVEGSLFDAKPVIRSVWTDGVRHEITVPDPPSLEGTWQIRSADVPSLEGTMTISDGPKVAWAAPVAEAPAGEADAGDGEPNDADGNGEAGGGIDADTDAESDDETAETPRPKKPTISRVRQMENRISMVLDGAIVGTDDPVAAGILLEGDRLLGEAMLPGGRLITFSGSRMAEEPDADADGAGNDGDQTGDGNGDGDNADAGPDTDAAADADPDNTPTVPESFGLPMGAYGLDELPESESLVILGGTVWTSGPDGIIEDGVVVIQDGRVTAVGAKGSVRVPGSARLVDATGKHVSPGLIDCHSHTGISGGVNEGTQNVTCEVRIADVIDPDDINWYRQLAGGITAVNQLHGSANPIGGQNSIVKLRWGVDDPDQMRLEGARPGVKWALGENVKQSNWGADSTGRYPQTRMGVEAIMRDRLLAGREYRRTWDAWNARPAAQRRGMTPPRRDLELEAMAEIVSGERLIHCHSYRQDEILMLCRLAEEFGFTIGTFQHVLEGYKVAEAIREHAIGGSCFSDWWAYKVEVFDAIPFNGAIMHEAGVNVSFNSDSDELARRMAAEAAKAVRYGGVDPAEALKFVTLNPAIQLDLGDRIGSLEAGKDADVVIWSGSPLSSLSRVERTYVDGRLMFSLERDLEMRERDQRERDRIIARVLAESGKGGGGGSGGGRGRFAADDHDDHHDGDDDHDRHDHLRAGAHDGHEHTDEELDLLAATWTYMIQNGIEPDGSRPGDCGCSIHDLLRERR
ncbi:MAG: amidohydrolase family protein [Phycisphaerales bacterium]